MAVGVIAHPPRAVVSSFSSSSKRTFYPSGALHKGGRDRANADLRLRVTGNVSTLFLSVINYIQTLDTCIMFELTR